MFTQRSGGLNSDPEDSVTQVDVETLFEFFINVHRRGLHLQKCE